MAYERTFSRFSNTFAAWPRLGVDPDRRPIQPAQIDRLATHIFEAQALAAIGRHAPFKPGLGAWRVLVFSQFVEMLRLIEADLTEAGISHLTLTGQTQNRAGVLDSFAQGEAAVFLLRLKAGGPEHACRDQACGNGNQPDATS